MLLLLNNMAYKYRDRDILSIPEVDRPREKLIAYGSSRLTNAELLAVVLRTGMKGENVVSLAERILSKFSSKAITTVTYEDLTKVKGLGAAKSTQIVAMFALTKRLSERSDTKEQLLSPKDIWNAMYDIRTNKKEHFVVFYLDARSRQIARETISVGTIDKNIVHPRAVFEPALRYGAAQVIFSHNHPSEDPTPSDKDVLLTRRLVDAGAIMGIEVLDHVIVGKELFFSFEEHKLM